MVKFVSFFICDNYAEKGICSGCKYFSHSPVKYEKQDKKPILKNISGINHRRGIQQ